MKSKKVFWSGLVSPDNHHHSVDNLNYCDYYLLEHLPLRKTTVFVNTLGKQDCYKGKHSQTLTFVQINFSLYAKVCSEICLGVKKLEAHRTQKLDARIY